MNKYTCIYIYPIGCGFEIITSIYMLTYLHKFIEISNSYRCGYYS